MKKHLFGILLALSCSYTALNAQVAPVKSFTPLTDLFTGNIHIIAYPNPASETSYIMTMLDRIETLELYDFNGKLVYSEKVPEGNTPVAVDVKGLQDGIYFARLRTMNGVTETKRINVLK